MGERGERKHHEKRLKAKRSNYFMASGQTPKQRGKVYHSPTLCSCSTCGNPRKHLRGKRGLTLQEKREIEGRGSESAPGRTE